GRTRNEASVCLGIFLFAMGAAILFQPLPVFNLFRQPARVAVVATFPIAWLGAASVASLLVPGGLTDEQRKACRRWFVLAVAGSVILIGGFALRSWIEGRPLLLQVYVVVVPPLLIVGWWSLSV